MGTFKRLNKTNEKKEIKELSKCTKNIQREKFKNKNIHKKLKRHL